MTQNIFYVYLHRFPNGVLYVGKGKGGRANYASGRNSYWSRLKSKYGKPRIKFLAKGISEEQAFKIEAETIERLKAKSKTICNLTNGGGGVSGFVQPRHQKIAYSESNSKKSHFVKIDGSSEFVGYQWEFVEITGFDDGNVSGLCRGRIMSYKGWRLAETKEWGNGGHRHPFYGKTLSDKIKEKIADATSGAKNHNYDHAVREFKNHHTGERFTGPQRLLADTYGLLPCGVSMMVSGRINAFKGWLPVDREYLGKASGSRNKYFNPTIYKFLIVSTGKVVESTQNDFKKQNPHIGHSELSAICRGKRKSTHGVKCLNPMSLVNKDDKVDAVNGPA